MKTAYFYGIATGLTAIAGLLVSAASVLFIYQGETPRELLEKK